MRRFGLILITSIITAVAATAWAQVDDGLIACVAPMATTTRLRAGSMSAASSVHPRSNSTARIDTGCWAIATA